jgi:hypothetical protein
MEEIMVGMIVRGRKGRLTGLFVGAAVCLALWPSPAWAGRRGADVKITLLDGGRINGELVAVFTDKIVVVSAIRESTVAVADIDAIAVAGNAAGWGVSRQLGALAGMALGFVAAGAYSRWYYDKYDGIPIWSYPAGIAGGAWLGSAAGGWISNKGDRDKLYPIKGRSPEAVARVMAKLKRKARLRVVY